MVGLLVWLLFLGTARLCPGRSVRRSIPQLGQSGRPGNFGRKTDARGYQWDVDSRGRVGDGSNDAFDYACTLKVNGQTFHCRSPRVSSNGKVSILTDSCGNIQVTRRIYLDVKDATLRYVDIFHNPTSRPVKANVVISTRVGSTAGAFWSDTGRANPNGLKKKEWGFMAWQQSHSRPSVLFLLRHGRRAKAPGVQIKSRRYVNIRLNRQIKPGKTVALTHGLAQRRLNSRPTTKKVKQLFKPFKSRDWLDGVPRKVRRRIINAGGMGFAGMPGEDLKSRLADLGVRRGNSDMLALGRRTRVAGKLRGADIGIETAYGAISYPTSEVAAIVGQAAQHIRPQLWLRNGQMLTGKLKFENLRFDSRAGPPISLRPGGVDRIVLQESEKDGKPGPDVLLFLETVRGDRVALTGGSGLEMSFITPWGVRRISAGEMRWMKRVREDLPGYVVGFRPKGRVFGFLRENELTFQTLDFGRQTFQAARIRGIYSASPEKEQASVQEIARPIIQLIGDNVLVGQFDTTQLHFVSNGEIITVNTERVRRLVHLTDDSDQAFSTEAVFEAELWDGGVVEGSLQERVVGVRTGDWEARVPVREIQEVKCPLPRVSEDLRKEIAGLIRQLGNSSWEKRRSATADLKDIGSLALPQLKEAVRQSDDAEVRRRAEKILKTMDQP